MCKLCAATARQPRIARRNFLRLAGVTAAGFAVAPRAFAKDTKTPPKPENVLSPDAALDRLMKGNVRYIDSLTKRHDFKHEREALSKGQNPFAAVLSCAGMTAVHAVRLSSLRLGQTAVVDGIGGVGILVVQAARHAGACAVQVSVEHADGMLRATVTDDGHGGADAARGTGLAGVERRLATFDGILAVSSPAGGPTIVAIEVPCALSSAKISFY